MALLALIERKCARLIAFFRFQSAPRDRHDDFADQIDDVGIGAAGRAQDLSTCRGEAMRPATVADAISKLSAMRRALSMNSAAAAGGQISRAVCSNRSSQRSKWSPTRFSGRCARIGEPW